VRSKGEGTYRQSGEDYAPAEGHKHRVSTRPASAGNPRALRSAESTAAPLCLPGWRAGARPPCHDLTQRPVARGRLHQCLDRVMRRATYRATEGTTDNDRTLADDRHRRVRVPSDCHAMTARLGARLLSRETVAQTGPQTGASISRGTTVLAGAATGGSRGTRPPIRRNSACLSHRCGGNLSGAIYATASRGCGTRGRLLPRVAARGHGRVLLCARRSSERLARRRLPVLVHLGTLGRVWPGPPLLPQSSSTPTHVCAPRRVAAGIAPGLRLRFGGAVSRPGRLRLQLSRR
jgi:hypothetical protein